MWIYHFLLISSPPNRHCVCLQFGTIKINSDHSNRICFAYAFHFLGWFYHLNFHFSPNQVSFLSRMSCLPTASAQTGRGVCTLRFETMAARGSWSQWGFNLAHEVDVNIQNKAATLVVRRPSLYESHLAGEGKMPLPSSCQLGPLPAVKLAHGA